MTDKKRLADARISLGSERYANVEAVAKAVERLPRVLVALPEAQRRELFGALVQRVFVFPDSFFPTRHVTSVAENVVESAMLR